MGLIWPPEAIKWSDWNLGVLELAGLAPPRLWSSWMLWPSAGFILWEASIRWAREERIRMDTSTDVVLALCTAWSDDAAAADLAAFFTDDATYRNIPLDRLTGKQNIADNIATCIRPGPPGIKGPKLGVINIAANGRVVMTERVGVFKMQDRSFELSVMGTFEVVDRKIAAWRDYFDMNQFLNQMGDHQS
jgi:limonene-1,2-epoxide hydrolase